jgi:hypothetical protein
VGDHLHTGTAATETVIGVRSFTGSRDMYNLTIADVHTYYVIASATPVLVHNCPRELNPAGPGDSPVWQDLKPFKGKTRTNGLNGKSRQYYQWDYTHNDIEVYDSKGVHLGSLDPVTGELYKPPVRGRTIDTP